MSNSSFESFVWGNISNSSRAWSRGQTTVMMEAAVLSTRSNDACGGGGLAL